MNSITVSGNLVKDPEMRYTPNGKAICSFTIGVNKKSGEKQETSFFDVKCFNTTAEGVRSLKKGNRVVVSGELKQETWEDKQTNQKRSRVVILGWDVARPVYGQQTESADDAPAPARQTRPAASDSGNAQLPQDEDDVPF